MDIVFFSFLGENDYLNTASPRPKLPMMSYYPYVPRDDYAHMKFSFDLEKDEARCVQKLEEATKKRDDAELVVADARYSLVHSAQHFGIVDNLSVAESALKFVDLFRLFQKADAKLAETTGEVRAMREAMKTTEYAEYAKYAAYLDQQKKRRIERLEEFRVIVQAIPSECKALVGRELICDNRVALAEVEDPTFEIGELVGCTARGSFRSEHRYIGSVVVYREDVYLRGGEKGFSYLVAASLESGECDDPLHVISASADDLVKVHVKL